MLFSKRLLLGKWRSWCRLPELLQSISSNIADYGSHLQQVFLNSRKLKKKKKRISWLIVPFPRLFICSISWKEKYKQDNERCGEQGKHDWLFIYLSVSEIFLTMGKRKIEKEWKHLFLIDCWIDDSLFFFGIHFDLFFLTKNICCSTKANMLGTLSFGSG